jgi:hypothetical protein
MVLAITACDEAAMEQSDGVGVGDPAGVAMGVGVFAGRATTGLVSDS